MKLHCVTVCVAAGLLLSHAEGAGKTAGLGFRQLPKEVRDHATEVRQACKELSPEKQLDDMQGIEVLDIAGTGGRDIVVDNEGLCGEHLSGANCSNRGCDLAIYKETSQGRWSKVFAEHVYAKFLAVDWETMRLQLMVVSIYAGDPKCKAVRGKEYTSGQSCNLIVRYRRGKWDWELIR